MNPFSVDCVASPLQCVPKCDCRFMICFPPRESVNDGIMPDEYLNQTLQFHLPGMVRLNEFINVKDPGSFFLKKNKKDLKQAYQQTPVDQHDYHLLGFSVDCQFYFHTVIALRLTLT